MKTEVKTLDAGTAGEIELSDAIFGLSPRADILHRVVTWQLAKRRAGTQSTKNRSEVTGSRHRVGRQKGGGTARHGDKYAPIFRGGGVAHAPKPRSHAIDLPKKVRKLGLKLALSAKAASGSLIVVDTLAGEAKTKAMSEKLAKMGLTNVLFIDGAAVDEAFGRAISNLINVDALPTQGANVYDILRRQTLVLSRAAVEALEARLG